MSERLYELVENLRPLDEKAKIIGSFLIQHSPIAYSARAIPRDIADGWVGLEVPIRFPPYLETEQKVWVTQWDTVASLLAQDRAEAAAFFDELGKDYPFNTIAWWFAANEGVAAIDSPIPTDAYYRYLQSRKR